MYLAQIRPEDVLVFVPFFIVLIPIIAILVRHQQRMAELIHGKERNGDLEAAVQQLTGEVHRLQAQVAQLALNAAAPKSVEAKIAERNLAG